MEQKEIKENFTFRDFIGLFKEINRGLIVETDNYNKINNDFNYCCEFEQAKDGTQSVLCRTTKLLKLSVSNPKKLACILENTFGVDQYDREDLDNLFKITYGIKFGMTFNKPKSYLDMANLISNYIEIINDKSISEIQRNDYAQIISVIENLIAKQNAKCILSQREMQIVQNGFNSIIKYAEANKLIELDNDKNFYSLVNKYAYLKDDLGNKEENLNLSSFVKDFVNQYNVAAKEDMENRPYQNKLNKYYKKLTKTGIEKMEDYSKFPKPEDPNFEKYCIDLLKRLDEENEYPSLTAILRFYYYDNKYKVKTK